MQVIQVACAICIATFVNIAIAADLKFESGEQQTVMIELFTSQGCSSCPPAEAYLNQYTGHRKLWKKFIPLAFHVDYWDYLGWKDNFAKPGHTRRQRAYGRVLRANTIYTPEFIVNGKEWRRSIFQSQPTAQTEIVGKLKVTLSGQQLASSFSPYKVMKQPLDLNIAVLGMGLHIDILAGENEGRKSQHEFVVLGYKRLNSQNLQWQTVLPQVEHNVRPDRLALVVWVSQKQSPVPIQAVAGFIGDG